MTPDAAEVLHVVKLQQMLWLATPKAADDKADMRAVLAAAIWPQLCPPQL